MLLFAGVRVSAVLRNTRLITPLKTFILSSPLEGSIHPKIGLGFPEISY